MKICITSKIDATNLKDISETLSIYIRGYAVFENYLYAGSDFESLIIKLYKSDSLINKIKEFSGCWQFALVDNHKKELLVVNDRWGTYPLYYHYKSNKLIIASDREPFINISDMKIDKTSALELSSLGYVQGKKTLLRDVFDFSPHSINTVNWNEKNINLKSNSYWHFVYQHQDADEKMKEKEFADLWFSRMKIYSDFLRKNNSSIYMLFSGGLDCRLLANEFDKNNISITALTYGQNREFKEIDSALQAFSYLKHQKGHFLEYLNESTIRYLKDSDFYPCPLTSAHFGQMMLDYFYNSDNKNQFIVTGFTGDLVAGSLIKNKMLKWKNIDNVLLHIINFRTAPLYKEFLNVPEFKNILENSIRDELIYQDCDLISMYVRWFLENDARRYLIRSVISHKNQANDLLLPFFDYEIFDFFLKLPHKLLINKRLYINTQIKYLYNNNKDILKVDRAKPAGKIKKVRNQYWEEYFPKLLLKLKIPGKVFKEKKSSPFSKMDWFNIYQDLFLPDFFPENIVNHKVIADKPTYIRYFHPVSRVFKELLNK